MNIYIHINLVFAKYTRKLCSCAKSVFRCGVWWYMWRRAANLLLSGTPFSVRVCWEGCGGGWHRFGLRFVICCYAHTHTPRTLTHPRMHTHAHTRIARIKRSAIWPCKEEVMRRHPRDIWEERDGDRTQQRRNVAANIPVYISVRKCICIHIY